MAQDTLLRYIAVAIVCLLAGVLIGFRPFLSQTTWGRSFLQRISSMCDPECARPGEALPAVRRCDGKPDDLYV